MDAELQTRLTNFLTANLGDKPFSFSYDENRKVCRISMPDLNALEYFTFYRWIDTAFPEVDMEFMRPILAKADNEILVDIGKVDLDTAIAVQQEAKSKIERHLSALQLQATIKGTK